jgi:hypothetical protein
MNKNVFRHKPSCTAITTAGTRSEPTDRRPPEGGAPALLVCRLMPSATDKRHEDWTLRGVSLWCRLTVVPVRVFLPSLLMSLLMPPNALAAIPDLVCQELQALQIDPRSLKVEAYESRTLYRFKGGKLYLSSPDRSEYLYNRVTETESLRYVSGHKTMHFESDSFRTLVLVHTYLDEVRVSRASCTRE